jgi:LPS-assembly lipoprotein
MQMKDHVLASAPSCRVLFTAPRPNRYAVGLVILSLALLLQGCGFQLSRPVSMPFRTLYVAAPQYSGFGAQFKRYLESINGTQLVDRPEQADVILQILNELDEAQILALSVGGRVNELQFRYRLTFRLHDRTNREWIPATEIVLHRDMTYDDQAVLAKEAEQALLVQDMREEAVRQMMRRLSVARPPS